MRLFRNRLGALFTALSILFSAPVLAVSDNCLNHLRELAKLKLDKNGNPTQLGIVVMVKRGNKILFGMRKPSFTWAFLSGHLEDSDPSLEHAARRETKEEADLPLENLKVLGAVETYVEEYNRNFLLFFVSAESKEGEPKLMEPNRMERWEWFDVNQIPLPLFPPNRVFLSRHVEDENSRILLFDRGLGKLLSGRTEINLPPEQ
jgi:8-oxo-dGTP diphosphatase